MKTIKKSVVESAGKKWTWKMKTLVFSLLMVLFAFAIPNPVSAHCDGLDGPVVKAAQKALETNNVNLILVWVQKDDEGYIRKAFEKTIKLRTISPEAKDLADTYFYETLVRIHRAGEGAPYTGLKPAGRDLGPAIPAADAAITSGSAKDIWSLLSNSIHNEFHEKFTKVEQLKNYDSKDVEKGREFIRAYVEYIHFAEKVYNITQSGTEHSPSQEATIHNH